MQRKRLAQALLLSVALHGLLVLLLARTAPLPRPALRPTPQEPLELEVTERTLPPRQAPPAAPARAQPPHQAPAPARPAAPGSPPPEGSPLPAAPPATPAGPTEPAGPAGPTEPAGPTGDMPRALVLLPPGLGAPSSGPAGGLPGSTGRTLRPGETESPRDGLAEGERVQQRVQGFMDDGLARLRVENGLAHSFFGEMDHALEKGLSGAPLFEYQGVLKHFFKATPENGVPLRELLASAGRYGATGNPYAIGEPTGTDRLDEVARSGAAGARARAQRSAADVLNEYSRRVGALHVKLELVQSPTGQVLSVNMVQSSGNPLFDTYVLERVPGSLSALGPAPEHFVAQGKTSVRSIWSIEGHVSFSRTLKLLKLHELDAADAAYVAALVPVGLLSGNFEETRGEVIIPDFRRPHFDITTRLLRVY